MKKRVLIVLMMAAVLIFTGCGNSNSAEEPIGADSPMTENEPDELFSIEGKVLEVNETNILINESGYENGECYLAISDDTVISLGGDGYFKELPERIRDIRASEKVFYRQI